MSNACNGAGPTCMQGLCAAWGEGEEMRGGAQGGVGQVGTRQASGAEGRAHAVQASSICRTRTARHMWVCVCAMGHLIVNRL